MKRTLLSLAVVLLVVLWPQVASAHVLITDSQAHVGAILHITPDDDPIAGQPSKLYFDIQNDSKNSLSFGDFELYITNEAGMATKVNITPSGTGLVATYDFPTQGLYKLALQTRAGTSPAVTLPYSLRVSRGVKGAGEVVNTPLWAQVGLLGSIALLAVLAILGFNNRYAIARRSKF